MLAENINNEIIAGQSFFFTVYEKEDMIVVQGFREEQRQQNLSELWNIKSSLIFIYLFIFL